MKYVKKLFIIFTVITMISTMFTMTSGVDCAFASEEIMYVPGSSSDALIVSNPSVVSVENGNLILSDWHPAAFDISDSIIYGNPDRNAVEVDVCYRDDFQGCFWINYVDVDGVQQQAGESVYSSATGTYKTVSFTLNRAALQNNAIYHEGIRGDFAITFEKGANAGNDATLAVSSVRVVISDTTTPVEVTATTSAVGNIFFDGDDKGFEIELQNDTNTLARKSVKYEILDYAKNEVYGEQVREYTVAPGQKVTDKVSLSFAKYGVFWFRVSTLDQSGDTERAWDYPFSICVKNENKSNDIGLNLRVQDRIQDVDIVLKGLDIIDKAGFGNVRYSYDWQSFQTGETEYAVPVASQEIIDKAHRLGIDLTLLHKGHNAYLFGNNYTLDPTTGEYTDMYMPKTDEERSAFAEYVYQSVKANRGKIQTIEIWNEPDVEYYDKRVKDNATGEYECDSVNPLLYAKLLKAVYQRVKPDFPDVTICGISNCEVSPWYVTSWALKVLEADTDNNGVADGYQWLDKISCHHYTKQWDEGVDIYDTMDHIAQFKQQVGAYGIDTDFYQTEFGSSSVASLGYEGQAERLSQYFLTLQVNNLGDKFFMYEFSNSGSSLQNTEANFGLVEAGWSDVPYAAKPSLVALSNMNKLLYGHDRVNVVTDSSAVKVYSFENSQTSYKVYSLYATDNTTYSFDPAEDDIIFIDAFGNIMEDVTQNQSGAYTLNLTGMPIYAVYGLSETGGNNNYRIVADYKMNASEGWPAEKLVSYTNGTAGTYYRNGDNSRTTFNFDEATSSNEIIVEYDFNNLTNGGGGNYNYLRMKLADDPSQDVLLMQHRTWDDTGSWVHYKHVIDSENSTITTYKNNSSEGTVVSNVTNLGSGFSASAIYLDTWHTWGAGIDNLVVKQSADGDAFMPSNNVFVTTEDGENDIVAVEAYLPNAAVGDPVGVKILDDSGNIVQVEQLFVNDEGKIRFRYRKESGKEYSLWLGTKGFKGVYVAGLNGNEAYAFINSDNSCFISALSELNQNSTFRVNVNVDAQMYPSFSVFCSTYNGEKMISVDKFGMNNMSYDADVNMYYRDINSSELAGADSVNLMVWDSCDSMVPLATKYALN